MTELLNKSEITVDTWGGRVPLRMEVLGTGPALIYLHPAGGLVWDDFLLTLSERYTIYAPVFPGMRLEDSRSIHEIDDIFDVVLAYEGALRAHGLVGVPVIGQSFGGMLTAELASAFPDLFSRVVLLDPAGLWNENYPWTLDFMSAPFEQLPGMLFKNPDLPRAQAMFPPPANAAAAIDGAVGAIWGLGCVAKFLWPVPDRGLSKRLHRINKPTLVVWGEDDALIPVAYAHEYGKAIAGARVEILPDCGHIPQVEQYDKTLALVTEFLT